MKTIFNLAALFVLMALAACSNKTEPVKVDDKRVLMQNTTDEKGVHRMQVSRSEQTVTFKEKEYKVSVVRTPNDSLARVVSEVGDLFVDNQITLKITRGTESVFHKTFTKQSFSSVVSAEFVKRSMLEGMVFEKTNARGIVFAVSMGYPQTDLFIPISVTIDGNGRMSVERVEEEPLQLD